MINITFVQYGGMTYRAIINLILKIDKNKFYVNFLWCKPGKDKYSSFKHPYPSKKDIQYFSKQLIDNNVNVVEFIVKERYIPDPNFPWENTNFWKIYNSIKTDIVFTWKSGRQEYPFCHMKESIIEWNVFGGCDISQNLVKSLAVSPFCKEEYLKNGGSLDKTKVVFLPVISDISKDDFRKELNISKNDMVVGMHQRAEDTIFSPISLNAIKNAQDNTANKIHIVFLGGSRLYSKYAKSIGLDNCFFLSPNGEKEITNNNSLASDYSTVSKFLNTLNIYTHARKDGETLGAAIQEAMMHELPIISHTSQWNAHIDTIGPGGKVCETQNEYNDFLIELINNPEKGKNIGEKGKKYAMDRYQWDTVLQQVESTFEEVYKNKDDLLKGWTPLSLDIYKKRKLYYFFRFFVLQIVTKLLVTVFGQKSTVILVKTKNFFRKIIR